MLIKYEQIFIKILDTILLSSSSSFQQFMAENDNSWL